LPGALANQPFTYPMQPLKVELFNRFDSDKLHSGTQHRVGIAEIFFVWLTAASPVMSHRITR
jgi:hypothetical protein